jgi:outer membrane protein, heavy metal efflux system
MSIPGRVSVLAIAVVALSTTVVAQDWTEQQIVEIALRDGPRARAIRAGADVARAEQRARTVLPNPTLAYSREGAGFTEFLQVEQTLPLLWGARAALLRAGVAATAAADADRDARLWNLRADVRRSIAELAAARDTAARADTAVRELDALVDRLRIREREGEGSRYDRLRAERELVEARRIVGDAGIRVAEARAALAAMLPPDQPIAMVTPSPQEAREIPSREILLARAREARPEIVALRHSSEHFGHEALAARRARLPQPTIIAGAKRADVETGRENGSAVGLNFTIPLFDTGTREAMRWQAERTRADAEAAALVQQLDTDVTRALDVLTIRRRAAFEYERGTQPDTDALEQIARTAYDEGELSLLELIDAHRADWNVRSQAIALRLHVKLAEIELERAVGAAIWP